MTANNPQVTYRFFVDGKPYETPNQFITGEQIRDIAHVDKHLRLFMGEPPGEQNKAGLDRQVMRHDRLDLGAPGEEKFYTLEPPTMDIY